jgi:ABC-type bacteriocin/lantibiotic exporter with double-glycine peptidase domain
MNGNMLLGNLFLFMLLLNFLYEPIYRINDVNKRLNDTLAQLKRVFEIIDNPEKESRNALSKNEKLSGIDSFQLEDLHFHFNQDQVIFENVNYRFEKNKIYLILGKSGIGKSTLFNLLIQIYIPTKGKILINGNNYNHYHYEQIRNKTVLSLQDNLFFSDTIQNIITFFSDKVDKHHLKESMEICQADTFVREMKNNINSELLEGGNNLSGGQKQRLNLARSIYDAKDKDVILLDEPTSSLDKYNESMFMKGLVEMKKNKIIIIISHRHSIRDYCDEVIHIENRNFRLQKNQE